MENYRAHNARLSKPIIKSIKASGLQLCKINRGFKYSNYKGDNVLHGDQAGFVQNLQCEFPPLSFLETWNSNDHIWSNDKQIKKIFLHLFFLLLSNTMSFRFQNRTAHSNNGKIFNLLLTCYETNIK
jgi:hypothetical protein